VWRGWRWREDRLSAPLARRATRRLSAPWPCRRSESHTHSAHSYLFRLILFKQLVSSPEMSSPTGRIGPVPEPPEGVLSASPRASGGRWPRCVQPRPSPASARRSTWPAPRWATSLPQTRPSCPPRPRPTARGLGSRQARTSVASLLVRALSLITQHSATTTISTTATAPARSRRLSPAITARPEAAAADLVCVRPGRRRVRHRRIHHCRPRRSVHRLPRHRLRTLQRSRQQARPGNRIGRHLAPRNSLKGSGSAQPARYR
jgi:hypothetical protein